MDYNRPPQKPYESIDKVCEHLAPHASAIIAAPGTRLPWVSESGESQIYLLEQGEVSIFRNSDGLLITTIRSPHIFGFAQAIHQRNQYQIRAETKSSLRKISADNAFELIDQEGIWQQIAMILAYHVDYLCYIDMQLVQQRAYVTIRSKLIELMQQPEEYRQRVSVISYIHQRTLLSRSGIMKVLAELRKGNYITLQRGHLTQLQNLPLAF